MQERILPINIIPKDSTVIIYGAGQIGKKYIEDNKKFHWCNIIAAVDKDAKNKLSFPLEVYEPKAIMNLKYDYVLIARASLAGEIEIQQIFSWLEDLGVPVEKILYDTSTTIWSKNIDTDVSDSITQGKDIRIAFITNSTIGDCIIGLKLFQTIVDMVYDITIDVYTNKVEVVKAIYYDQKGLGDVYGYVLDKTTYTEYDLVLKTEFEPIVKYYNSYSLRKKDLKFADLIERIITYHKKNYSDMPVGVYTSGIRLNRARFWKLNRYTIQSCGGIIPIIDSKVNINLNKNNEKEFKDLRLEEKYITINYGASNPTDNGIQQTKVWPREHFEKLISLLKEKFPKIQIVQLGENNSQKLKGIDRVVFGKNLELVKYILLKSMFHVDSESGLVHLATQLGTKCFVMFGPTPIWFFGYEQNTNFEPEVCGECKDLIPDWYFRCLNFDEPECMKSVKPEVVYKEIKKYLDNN